MKRRRGITLVEVLVAIFIMAIGLLALLTLFPLGALNMARALKDDRTATAASNAANLCDAFGERGDPNFPPLFQNPPAGSAGFQPANPAGPGYPIFVDPYGLQFGNPAVVGNSGSTTPPTPGISRVAPTLMPAPLSGAALVERYFTLFDDLSFDPNGLPPGGTVQRGDQYTWAYMLQCPQSGSPQNFVNLTVVVYYNRPQVPGGETTFPVLTANGATLDGHAFDTSVTVTWPAGQPAPTVVRGTWILDSSYEPLGVYGYVHGDFYRVVGVSQVGSNAMTLEVQSPFARSVTAVTVLDDVADVFNRGSNTAPSPVPTP